MKKKTIYRFLCRAVIAVLASIICLLTACGTNSSETADDTQSLSSDYETASTKPAAIPKLTETPTPEPTKIPEPLQPISETQFNRIRHFLPGVWLGGYGYEKAYDLNAESVTTKVYREIIREYCKCKIEDVNAAYGPEVSRSENNEIYYLPYEEWKQAFREVMGWIPDDAVIENDEYIRISDGQYEIGFGAVIQGELYTLDYESSVIDGDKVYVDTLSVFGLSKDDAPYLETIPIRVTFEKDEDCLIGYRPVRVEYYPEIEAPNEANADAQGYAVRL